jgi:hypothetical protein
MADLGSIAIYAVLAIIVILIVIWLMYPDDFRLYFGIAPTTPWVCNQNVFGSPIRRGPTGDVQCQSLDGKYCRASVDNQPCQHYLDNPVPDKPLTCGKDMLAKWGSTGYGNPSEWCTVVNNYLPKPNTKLVGYYDWQK